MPPHLLLQLHQILVPMVPLHMLDPTLALLAMELLTLLLPLLLTVFPLTPPRLLLPRLPISPPTPRLATITVKVTRY
jgi:hypothetical protein